MPTEDKHRRRERYPRKNRLTRDIDISPIRFWEQDRRLLLVDARIVTRNQPLPPECLLCKNEFADASERRIVDLVASLLAASWSDST
jgi:hypothetical protein